MRWVLAAVVLLGTWSLSPARPQDKADEEKDEMVVNPFYAHWANFAPGAKAVHTERTVLGGESKSEAPDGVDEKQITYTLLEVTPDKAVVRAVVLEREFLSSIESAPTKIIYHAKVKKSHLDAVLHDIGAKRGTETIKVLGKPLKCNTIAGIRKRKDEEIKHKIWYSTKVPGGVVKRTRATSQDGKLVAETTITLKSYKGKEAKEE
jgi:hypothetical protein